MEPNTFYLKYYEIGKRMEPNTFYFEYYEIGKILSEEHLSGILSILDNKCFDIEYVCKCSKPSRLTVCNCVIKIKVRPDISLFDSRKNAMKS